MTDGGDYGSAFDGLVDANRLLAFLSIVVLLLLKLISVPGGVGTIF
jgi:hypothetical protein